MLDSDAPSATVLIRLQTGLVFLLEGIKKFLFPTAWGVGRFIHIGIPAPHLMAPLVGLIEIAAGFCLIIGLASRVSALLLLGVISGALLSTKLPLLLHSGFWAMEADARADFAMFCGTLYLVIAGSGAFALDRVWLRRIRSQTGASASPSARTASS